MIRKILVFAVFVCAASALAKPSAYDLEILRQHSQFRDFEKYFDVDDVQMSLSCEKSLFSIKKASDLAPKKPYLYTIWAISKKQNPLRKLSLKKFLFKFSDKFKNLSFEKYSSELCEGIYAAIHKNLPFEKWLKGRIDGVAGIEYEEQSWSGVTKNEIFRSVGITGKYVGALNIGSVLESRYTGACGGGFSYNLFPKYEFWFSDDGDIFVSKAFFVSDEPLLDSVLNEGFSYIKRCKESEKVSISFDCYYSIVSNEKCQTPISKTDVPYRFPQFCDYLIIRHDGTIEYGPKSGEL